jgi:putative FmdB family regulatory protein
MPLYAYRCKECQHEFEKNQRMSESPLTECPQCQGEIRRVINSVGVVFKGSGFYVTDNKTKNPAAPIKVGDDASSSPATEAGAGAGTEAKPKENGAATPPTAVAEKPEKSKNPEKKPTPTAQAIPA